MGLEHKFSYTISEEVQVRLSFKFIFFPGLLVSLSRGGMQREVSEIFFFLVDHKIPLYSDCSMKNICILKNDLTEARIR